MTERFARATTSLFALGLATGAWACGEGSPPSSSGPVTSATTTGGGGEGTGASGGVGQGPGGSPAGAGGVGGGAGGEAGGAGGTGGSAPFCGDGVVDSGESCDDGNHANDDSCPDDVLRGGTCELARCGDGHVWSTDGGSETCDDANGDDTDDCPDCAAATCDDGLWHNAGSGDEIETDCGGSCGPCTRSLLLTEIVLGPTGAELIEIHNPGLSDVPLENVYLADYADYYLITQGTGAPAATDFRVTFPGGSVVPAGGHVVVSTASATAFSNTYGEAPDFDLSAADGGAPVMLGELTDISRLGGTQEMLVLFYWDGASDLVTDIDYLVWGNTSLAMDKSNVVVGASAYAPETPPGMQSAAPAPPANVALARCLYGEGDESRGGGNGFAGAEETSEDHANTWRAATPTPGTFNGCSTLAAVTPGASELHYVDRDTYAELQTVPIVGDRVDAVGAVAIARDPLSGRAHVVLKDANTLRHLAELNPATGRARVVGQLSDSVAALAFDAAGGLHGMTGDGGLVAEDFITIDPTSALSASVLSLETNACCGEALAFNPDDGLFYRFTGLSPALLQSVDASGPSALDVSYTGAEPAEATGAFWDGEAGVFVVFDGARGVLTVAPDGTATDTGLTTATKLRGGLIP